MVLIAQETYTRQRKMALHECYYSVASNETQRQRRFDLLTAQVSRPVPGDAASPGGVQVGLRVLVYRVSPR